MRRLVAGVFVIAVVVLGAGVAVHAQSDDDAVANRLLEELENRLEEIPERVVRGYRDPLVKLMLGLALVGKSDAQSWLGQWALEQEAYGEAVYWFRKAAVQGDVDAQNRLGILYWEGQGVEEDHLEASLFGFDGPRNRLGGCPVQSGCFVRKRARC